MITLRIYNREELSTARKAMRKFGFPKEAIPYVAPPVIIEPSGYTQLGLLRALMKVCGIQEPVLNVRGNHDFILEVNVVKGSTK